MLSQHGQPRPGRSSACVLKVSDETVRSREVRAPVTVVAHIFRRALPDGLRDGAERRVRDHGRSRAIHPDELVAAHRKSARDLSVQPDFSNVSAAGSTPTTSPISGARSARWPPAPPEKTAPRASDCSAEARSSRYRATFQPPSVIRFGECTAITALRPDKSTPSLLPSVTCHASSTSQLSWVAVPSHTQLQLTSQLHTSK